MANMLDYLTWRGDLPFARDPMNETDSLIFTELAYAEWAGIVPSPDTREQVNLFGACEEYVCRNRREADLINDPRKLVEAVIGCQRYMGVRMSAYVNVVDPEKEEQLSAVTFLLPNGTAYVAFRGTDSSLTGWREDFAFSFLRQTPAQKAAAEYLEMIASRHRVPLYVGGHSKGGNLAVYAAAFARLSDPSQVVKVYSNDGPGFNSKITETPEYQAVIPRVRMFLPESSLVGILLENYGRRTVIKSTGIGIQQHDPYTWEVTGCHLTVTAERSASSLFMDEAMRRWLADMDDDEKKAFTAAVFDSMEETGSFTLTRLRQAPAVMVNALIAGLRMLTGDRQRQFLPVMKKLLEASGGLLLENSMRSIREKLDQLNAALNQHRPGLKGQAMEKGLPAPENIADPEEAKPDEEPPEENSALAQKEHPDGMESATPVQRRAESDKRKLNV